MKLYFVVLILMVHGSVGMKPFNFCKKANQKCVGSYNQNNVYEEKCELDKCSSSDQFKYDCGFDSVCARNKLSCRQLNETRMFIKNIDLLYTRIHEMNKFRKYISNFNACPLGKVLLKSNDICLNGQNCFYVEPSHDKKRLIKKPIICPCRAQRSYHCGDFYCATNSITCDLMITAKNKDYSFQRCFNDDFVLRPKS